MAKIFKWIGQRAKEKTTYAGLATIAVLVGKPELAEPIGKIGQIAGMVLGGGLMFMTSKVQAE